MYTFVSIAVQPISILVKALATSVGVKMAKPRCESYANGYFDAYMGYEADPDLLGDDEEAYMEGYRDG